MENFSGPIDEAERRRMGNQRFVGGPEYAGRGPLDPQVKLSDEGMEKLNKLVKLESQMNGVDAGVLEVEQHIIERMKAEVGASNLKALAKALEITRKLERRNA